ASNWPRTRGRPRAPPCRATSPPTTVRLPTSTAQRSPPRRRLPGLASSTAVRAGSPTVLTLQRQQDAGRVAPAVQDADLAAKLVEHVRHRRRGGGRVGRAERQPDAVALLEDRVRRIDLDAVQRRVVGRDRPLAGSRERVERAYERPVRTVVRPARVDRALAREQEAGGHLVRGTRWGDVAEHADERRV